MIFNRKNNKSREDEDYWNRRPEAAYISQWTNNRIIGSFVYQRISGGMSSKHWLQWLLEDYFAGKHFDRLLSPGCGTGLHEIIIARSGIVKHIDAFDFSASALDLARKNAANSGFHINFYKDDINTFQTPENHYQIVLCTGSAHHVKELEYFFSTVRKALCPEGYFILNEYVGDCYNIYNHRQVDLINRLYQHIPEKFRSGKAAIFENPTIEKVMSSDPSESVRSKLILSMLEYYFHIELYRPYGGFILHPLYPLLDDKIFSMGDSSYDTILKILLEFESILMEYGVFETDFAFCICRPK